VGEFDAFAYQSALQLFSYLVDLKIQPGELAFVDGKRLYERFQHSRQLAPMGRCCDFTQIEFPVIEFGFSLGQPRRCGPKWSPGYDIAYTFVRSDGYVPLPAIKTMKKLPDDFVTSFNTSSGAYLFHRDKTRDRHGVQCTLEALRHYHRIGAFKSVRVRTLSVYP